MCAICDELESGNIIIRGFGDFSVMFNRYPYTLGSLMIVTRDHIANLEDLSDEQAGQLIILIKKIQIVLKKTFDNSVNVGINSGPKSGGTIVDHFHVHIIPRTANDFNFTVMIDNLKPMGSLKLRDSDIKKISELIQEIQNMPD